MSKWLQDPAMATATTLPSTGSVTVVASASAYVVDGWRVTVPTNKPSPELVEGRGGLGMQMNLVKVVIADE